MKSPKSSSRKRTNRTPKITQPKPLKVVHPSQQIAAPEPSSQEQPGTPSVSRMHVGSKRPIDSTMNKSLSKSAKRAKIAVPNSAEEISKKMIESLMAEYCCNPIYPDLMREFILKFSIDNVVCTSKVKEVKIEFNSLTLGYGGLLSWIFRKFGVPLEGLNFPMGPNNKIGAKCLNNLHLKLYENGILENVTEQIDDHFDKEEEINKADEENKEQEEEVIEKEEQEPVPSTNEKAEGCSEREHEEVPSKGETVKEDEAVEKDKEENDVRNEEVSVPVEKQPSSTPRKSRRLTSKGKRPVVILDDDSTSYKTAETSNPSSPKPTTPLSHHFPSPPQSPIPSSPLPIPTHTSPNHGFDHTTVPTAPLFSILLKLNDL
ncbi:uncharacterized protein LOC130818467 [Amaranthus tricolor]|uniref:uncharacterized protein LOC130818467 n=1 Tax=Amaranthus tricolor TaxID=29722 RepID=UPI00258FB550|nr:uncharacterized protein LOC130818467 [Amaranthus tricolor]